MVEKRDFIIKFQVPTTGEYQADFAVYLGFGVLYVNFELTKYGTFENWTKGCCAFVISLAGLVAGCGTFGLIPGGSESLSIVSIPTQIHVDYGDGKCSGI